MDTAFGHVSKFLEKEAQLCGSRYTRITSKMAEVWKSTHSTHMQICTENAAREKMEPLMSLEESLSCWVCLILDSCKQGKAETLRDMWLRILWQWTALLDFLLKNEKGSVDCWRRTSIGPWRKAVGCTCSVRWTELTPIIRIKLKWCEAGLCYCCWCYDCFSWRCEVVHSPESSQPCFWKLETIYWSIWV